MSGGGGGRRRRARSLALRVLFELEGTEKDAGEVLAYQAADLGASGDVVQFARHLVAAYLDDGPAIDELLRAASRWPLAELGKVERAVLRLAVAEMRSPGAAPAAVVIDESCELTRAYAGEEAVQYVNGVLGRIAREAA